MIRLFLLSLTFALLAPVAGADEAAHQAAATKLVNLLHMSEYLRASFVSTMDGMLDGMAKNGMPPAGVKETREVFTAWYDRECKWEDIKPKIVEIYAQHFTEAELDDIAAFYGSPSGKKALTEMPAVFREGVQAGIAYGQTKQASLQPKLKALLQKYPPKARPLPGATP